MLHFIVFDSALSIKRNLISVIGERDSIYMYREREREERRNGKS